MAYDDKNQVVVLYGGGAVNADPARTDTWTWDGTDWTEQHPDAVPGESFGGVMSSDTVGALMVRSDGTTWRWTGVRWSAQIGAAPALTNAGLAADQAGWVLFGGGVGLMGPGAARRETYRLQGSTWRHLVTRSSPGGGNSALAYDPRRRVILEVGQDGTWTFDGSSWKLAAGPEVSPPWEYWGQLAFDETRSEAVYFGVKGGGAGKTWTWNGSSWSTPCTTTDPGTMTVCPFAGPVGSVVALDGQGCDPGPGSQPASAYLVLENGVEAGTAAVGAVDFPSVPVDPGGHFHVTVRIPAQLHSLQGRGGGALTPGTYDFGSRPPICGVPFVVTSR